MNWTIRDAFDWQDKRPSRLPWSGYVWRPVNLVEIIVKRLFDIVVSVAALALLSPLLALVAALIRLDSNGPALFTQRRYGFNQEAFRIFKFRPLNDDGGRTRYHPSEG